MQLRVVRRTDRFDDTLAFYTAVLGWSVDRAWTEGGRGVLITAGDPATATARIELLEAPTGQVDAVSGVFVSAEVADAAALADRLVAAGHPVTQPLATQPWGHRNVATVDPSGLPVVLYEVL